MRASKEKERSSWRQWQSRIKSWYNVYNVTCLHNECPATIFPALRFPFESAGGGGGEEEGEKDEAPECQEFRRANDLYAFRCINNYESETKMCL